MNFKIDCVNYVMLYGLDKVSQINAIVSDYKLESDTLKGNVQVFGEYTKTGQNEMQKFSDTIPFTVLFVNDQINVDNISIENLDYKQLNDGIEVNFKVSINYLNKEEIEEVKENNEKIVETNNEDIFIETTHEDLTEIVEEKLDELLNGKRDEQIPNDIEEIKPVDDKIELTKNKIVPFDIELKESKNKIRIIYFNNEKDIEKISKEQNLSIDKLYNSISSEGENKRIIMKE